MKTTNRLNGLVSTGEDFSGRTTDHYGVLGVDFSLSTDSTPVGEFFRAAYRRFLCAKATSGALEMTAMLGPGTPSPFARAGETHLDLTGRPMPGNRAFLFLLNALMDRVSDFLVVHGAAFSIGDRGFILAGPPSAGKSTLALELCRKGAVFFSDDVAPLNRSTGMLHPFPRAIGVRRDATASAWVDIEALPSASVHTLPHKWLVDAGALGLNVASPGDYPIRVASVFYLATDGRGASGQGGPAGSGERHLEIALAEADQTLLEELAATPGISRLEAVPASPFPLFAFSASRSSHAMLAIADLCRRHRDVVLFLDEQRPAHPERPIDPVVTEAKWSVLLIELARELLNRSETGLLMKSCGNLAGLVSELSRVLSGARAWRLQSGDPGRTADLILELTGGRRSAA